MSLGIGLGLTVPRGGPSIAAWALEGSALDLDFVGKRYAQSELSKDFASLFSFSRASVGMAQKLDGSWETFASGVPRITDKGLLIEEARTNSILRNDMGGSSAGGSIPTGWAGSLGGVGLTASLPNKGTEKGLTYLDYRVEGTTNGTPANVLYYSQTSDYIAASPGQVWVFSAFHKIVAGSIPASGALDLTVREYDNANAFLRQTLVSIGAQADLTRVLNTVTIGASTAKIQVGLRISGQTGVTWDLTFRIAAPQLEQGAFATSPIPTSGSAVTRATELLNLSIANSEPFYDAAGSAYAEIDLPSASHAFGRVYDVGTRLLYTDSGNNFMVFSRDSANRNSGTPIIRNAVFKVACKWGATEHKIVTQGTTIATLSSSNTITPAAAFIGNRATGDRALCGYIKRLAVYPDELADATLTAMVAPSFVWDTDALAHFTAMETAGATPWSSDKKEDYDALVKAIKAAGAWDDIDAGWLYNDADPLAWERSIKGGFGTTSRVGCSATEADGLTTDGVVGSGHQTNYNPFTAGGVFTQNDAMVAAWLKTEPTSTGPCIGGGTFWANLRDASNRLGFRANDGTTANSATNTQTSALGLNWMQREDVSNKRSYRDASATHLGHHVVTTTALANSLMHVMCNSLGQNPPQSNRTLFAMFGRQLNSTKRAAVHAALLAYFQARGTLA